jgi:hypothetical protein
LEKEIPVFPSIGKFRGKFSKAWKISDDFFQAPENSATTFPGLLKTEVDQIVACRGDQPTPACGHPPKEETRNSSLS